MRSLTRDPEGIAYLFPGPATGAGAFDLRGFHLICEAAQSDNGAQAHDGIVGADSLCNERLFHSTTANLLIGDVRNQGVLNAISLAQPE